MSSLAKLALATMAALCVLLGAAAPDDARTGQIKKWKADPVELLDKPGGTVVSSKPAAELPLQAVCTDAAKGR